MIRTSTLDSFISVLVLKSTTLADISITSNPYDKERTVEEIRNSSLVLESGVLNFQ
jgi:hypothetical protein